MTKQRFAYDTKQQFIEAVHMYVQNYDEAANEIWDQMEALFANGERQLLVVNYDNDRETMNHEKVTSIGELAFIVAHLFSSDYEPDLDRNEVVAFDNNHESVFFVEYRSLEPDYNEDDGDNEDA